MNSAPEKIDYHRRRFVGTAALAVASAQLGMSASADAAPRAPKHVLSQSADKPDPAKVRASVVLVHGAWADGSGWDRVIAPLQAKGLKAMAAPIPLTSLSDDTAALTWALERTDGPVVLVAHAYSGAVVGACRNERVQALVFITSLTPDEGETVAEVFSRKVASPASDAGQAQSALDTRRPVSCRLVSERLPQGGGASGRNAAPYRGRVHPGEGAGTAVEDKAFLVPRCRGRSDDQPGHAAFPRAPDGRADSIQEGRPCRADYSTGPCGRHDPSGRRQYRRSSQWREIQHPSAWLS